MPAPSPRQQPSASVSKGLHGPVALKNPLLVRSSYCAGLVMILTPPAKAAQHLPERIATAEDEQAVSYVMEGPVQPH